MSLASRLKRLEKRRSSAAGRCGVCDGFGTLDIVFIDPRRPPDEAAPTRPPANRGCPECGWVYLIEMVVTDPDWAAPLDRG